AALLDEELLAGGGVASFREPDGAAAGRDERRERGGQGTSDPDHLRRRPRSDGFVPGRVDREDAVEARDLEDLRDVAVAADERELAVVLAQALHAADVCGGVVPGRG